jgi:2-polyprenyl-6-methoxyphenol hydroxylase-like FAD-dependent oxidoreductase
MRRAGKIEDSSGSSYAFWPMVFVAKHRILNVTRPEETPMMQISPSTTTALGDHAVVLGASMSGLLAARVLADSYRKVTIVERDVLPKEPVNRRGVPQGRHAHALLARGSQVLDDLFPGLLSEIVEAGAPITDGTDLSERYFSIGGHLFPSHGRPKDPTPLILPSRPLLEYLVRQRIRKLPNIVILEAHDVVNLTSTGQHDRVNGARVQAHNGGAEKVLAAQLVVDATGRGSRTPLFLDHLGYGRPTQTTIDVRLTYTSLPLRLAPGALTERVVIIGGGPAVPTGMALFRNENDTWTFTTFAMGGREVPVRFTEMLAFVQEFAPPHLMAALRNAEPLGLVAQHRIPSSQWRRYDKMQRFPTGLLVFGDAICSFNPIYGQGMTVAALQAQALRQCLQHGAAGLAERFFRAAAKPISVAWQLAAGGDLNLPHVKGPRPLSVRIANIYVDRLQRAAESDIEVAEPFLRVTGLMDPPSRLLHPKVLFRVASTGWRRHSHHRPPQMGPSTTIPTPAQYGHSSTHL